MTCSPSYQTIDSMKVVISGRFIWAFGLLYRSRVPKLSGVEGVMAAWRRAIELSLGDSDTAKLRSTAQSRTEPASRVERARILLAYREDPSFFAVGRALGLHHQTVQRCVECAVPEGPMAALDDRRSMRWSRIAIAAANSSNSSSFSTPPIRPRRRSS